MERNRVISKLLRLLADSIESGSESDFDRLISGRAKLVFSSDFPRQGRAAKKRAIARPEKSHRTEEELRHLNERLGEFESRDEGMAFLLNASLNKRDVERMARFLDLPVLREDDLERLRQKVVEARIGSRLNSRAIRGE